MISILWKTVIEIGISYENILLQFTSTTKSIQIIFSEAGQVLPKMINVL